MSGLVVEIVKGGIFLVCVTTTALTGVNKFLNWRYEKFVDKSMKDFEEERKKYM